MHEYIHITSVSVRLSSNRSIFPVTAYAGDPTFIEEEVARLAECILKPGYPGLPNPEKRIALLRFIDPEPEEVRPDGMMAISEEKIFGRKSLMLGSNTCKLVIKPEVDGIMLEFNDEKNMLIRKGFLPRTSYAQTKEKYDARLEYCAKKIAKAKKALIALDRKYKDGAPIRIEMTESSAVFNEKLKIISAEAERRAQHNEGAELIGCTMWEQGVVLRNRTLTHDLGRRIFEMINFLETNPDEKLAMRPIAETSRRRVGQFRDVVISADQLG